MLTITVDLESEVPVYRQIVDQIRRHIARGRLSEGDTLPSVRKLGAMVGVNLNTVARAYRLLAEEQLIDLRHGSGARVIAPPQRGSTDGKMAPEDHQQLEALFSRWLLEGLERKTIEQRLRQSVAEFFRPDRAESKEGGSR